MSLQQQETIVQVVTGLDWSYTVQDEAIDAVRDKLRCSHDHAKKLIDDLMRRNVIRCDSGSGQGFKPWYEKKTEWKYFRNPSMSGS